MNSINSIVTLSDITINTVCRHDSKKPCLKPSTACQTCQVNIDHALKVQADMEDYWKCLNNGGGDN